MGMYIGSVPGKNPDGTSIITDANGLLAVNRRYSTTLSSAANQIQVTGIASGLKRLRVVLWAPLTGSFDSGNLLRMTVNSVATGYAGIIRYSNGTTWAETASAATSWTLWNNNTGITPSRGVVVELDLFIADGYAKAYTGSLGFGDDYTAILTGTCTSTAAVTSLTFDITTNQFATGTVLFVEGFP